MAKAGMQDTQNVFYFLDTHLAVQLSISLNSPHNHQNYPKANSQSSYYLLATFDLVDHSLLASLFLGSRTLGFLSFHLLSGYSFSFFLISLTFDWSAQASVLFYLFYLNPFLW